MKKHLISFAAIMLVISACTAAPVAPVTPTTTPGIFVPTASLDPSQVEVVPPTVYVKVTPQECIDALDADQIIYEALDNLERADSALIDALFAYAEAPTKKNLAKVKKAVTAYQTALQDWDQWDFDKINALREACYNTAEVTS